MSTRRAPSPRQVSPCVIVRGRAGSTFSHDLPVIPSWRLGSLAATSNGNTVTTGNGANYQRRALGRHRVAAARKPSEWEACPSCQQGEPTRHQLWSKVAIVNGGRALAAGPAATAQKHDPPISLTPEAGCQATLGVSGLRGPTELSYQHPPRPAPVPQPPDLVPPLRPIPQLPEAPWLEPTLLFR